MKTQTILAMSIILSLIACSGPAARSEYETNLAKWQDKAVGDYTYRISIGCFCPYMGQMPLTVVVHDGKAVSMKTADGSNPAQNAESYRQVDTIDKLFGILAGAQASADEVKVSYDPTYGYPQSIAIDYIKNAVDDETSYQVSGFEVLPADNP
jgi:hypothetical protein